MDAMFEKRWTIDMDDMIGSGGFGHVYSAMGTGGTAVAAKFIPRAAGVDRELLAVELPTSPHLVPILDVGEVNGSWVIIMPRAERSLRDFLNSGGLPEQSEALRILTQIAQGLAAMDGRIVHRDLKPENILYLNGSWAVCDFGIARYADASTAADTKKFSLTPPYAAPEQWRTDHATSATDVYSFGVIAYELLTGFLPFPGPTPEDFRDQHLHIAPPNPATNRRLKSLLLECLDKAQAARPRPQNIATRLERVGQESRLPGVSHLASANQVVLNASTAKSRAAQAMRTEDERRAALFMAATSSYSRIVEEFVEIVHDEAPTASIQTDGVTTSIRLGLGSFAMTHPQASSARTTNFDVIAYGQILISQSGQKRIQRSHSLYFCDLDESGVYAWYELAFIAMFEINFAKSPYALAPSQGLDALESSIGGEQLGRPIVRLVVGDMDDALDRWIGYLGQAGAGTLESPTRLPEGFPLRPRR